MNDMSGEGLAGTRRLYLELLKKSVLGELYWENEARLLYLRDCLHGLDRYLPETLLRIEQEKREFCQQYLAKCRAGRVRDNDLENLGFQHTMIGRRRLENLSECLQSLDEDGIRGDLIECGVWRAARPSSCAVFSRHMTSSIGRCGWPIRSRAFRHRRFPRMPTRI